MRPIGEQADWIADALADGRIDLGAPGRARRLHVRRARLDAAGLRPRHRGPVGRARRWSRGAQAREERGLVVAHRGPGMARRRPRRRPDRRGGRLIWQEATAQGPSLLHQLPLASRRPLRRHARPGRADDEALGGCRRVRRGVRRHRFRSVWAAGRSRPGAPGVHRQRRRCASAMPCRSSRTRATRCSAQAAFARRRRRCSPARSSAPKACGRASATSPYVYLTRQVRAARPRAVDDRPVLRPGGGRPARRSCCARSRRSAPAW